MADHPAKFFLVGGGQTQDRKAPLMSSQSELRPDLTLKKKKKKKNLISCPVISLMRLLLKLCENKVWHRR